MDWQLKNKVNSNISTCPPQYGELQSISGWERLASSGHPSKFQRFRVLASLLQRRCSTEANQTLHNVWPSPALVHYRYIHFWRFLPPGGICQVQNSLCIHVLRAPILAASLHSTSAAGIGQTVELRRERHLYSAGRPSRWASAHILVCVNFMVHSTMYCVWLVNREVKWWLVKLYCLPSLLYIAVKHGVLAQKTYGLPMLLGTIFIPKKCLTRFGESVKPLLIYCWCLPVLC